MQVEQQLATEKDIVAFIDSYWDWLLSPYLTRAVRDPFMRSQLLDVQRRIAEARANHQTKLNSAKAQFDRAVSKAESKRGERYASVNQTYAEESKLHAVWHDAEPLARRGLQANAHSIGIGRRTIRFWRRCEPRRRLASRQPMPSTEPSRFKRARPSIVVRPSCKMSSRALSSRSQRSSAPTATLPRCKRHSRTRRWSLNLPRLSLPRPLRPQPPRRPSLPQHHQSRHCIRIST